MSLLAASPGIMDLRMQSDALLSEPARTLARFALAKMQFDAQYKRQSLYLSSLVFAGIPLIERKFNRIPEEKVAKLIELLCALQTWLNNHNAHLPPNIRLLAIPWCQVSPGELTNEATFQVVNGTQDAKVRSSTDQFALSIQANTMKDAAGNPVPFAFFSVLPLQRRAPGSEDSYPCPDPFDDPEFGNANCFPEFYELTVRPLVQFTPTKALLEICQVDEEEGDPETRPYSGAFLALFTLGGDGDATPLLDQSVDEGLPTNSAACAEDDDLHDSPSEEPGPIGFSPQGIRNAFHALADLGARALKWMGPRTLNALNVPTHGRLERELIDDVGTIIGAFDRCSGSKKFCFSSEP